MRDVINRLVMVIVAILLLGIPVILLLVAFGVIPARTIGSYTGYTSALDFLQGLSSLSALGTAIGVGGVIIAIVALLLFLAELPLGRRALRRFVLTGDPSGETVMSTRAVCSLTEGAAREAGALSPSIKPATKRGSYRLACNIQAPGPEGLADLASRVRDNVRKVLEDQGIPVKSVEVTVRGTGQQRGRRKSR